MEWIGIAMQPGILKIIDHRMLDYIGLLLRFIILPYAVTYFVLSRFKSIPTSMVSTIATVVMLIFMFQLFEKLGT